MRVRRTTFFRTEVAFAAVLVSARRVLRILSKFDPGQPRVPAGGPGGGRWTSGGGAGGIGSGLDLGELSAAFVDGTDATPWDYFVNFYAGEDLAAQILANDDGTTTRTEWDTGEVQDWAARQTVIASTSGTISKTILGRNGGAEIIFGPGADGSLALTAVYGQLALAAATDAAPGTIAFQPSDGDKLYPLTNSAMRMLASGAGGAGAFVVGMTAFPTEAGGDSITPLSDDVRLRLVDNGRPPSVEMRDGDGTWMRQRDVPISSGPAATHLIDGDALKSAIGETRFSNLGNLDGGGVAIAMQPAAVATRDVPPDSIFAGDRGGTPLYAPQGTVVDWSQPYASADAGQATVLELRQGGPKGLTWTKDMAQPMIGALDIEQVDNGCPRFSDVHQVAVEADIKVRAENPGLSARELGTLIHQEFGTI